MQSDDHDKRHSWKKLGTRVNSPDIPRDENRRKFIPKVNESNSSVNVFSKYKQQMVKKTLTSNIRDQQHLSPSNFIDNTPKKQSENPLKDLLSDTKWLYDSTARKNSPDGSLFSQKEKNTKQNQHSIKKLANKSYNQIIDYKRLFESLKKDLLRQMLKIKKMFVDCVLILQQKYQTQINQIKRQQHILPTDSINYGYQCKCMKQSFNYLNKDKFEDHVLHKEEDQFIKMIENNLAYRCKQVRNQQQIAKRNLKQSSSNQDLFNFFKFNDQKQLFSPKSSPNNQYTSQNNKNKSFEKLFETLHSMKTEVVQHKIKSQLNPTTPTPKFQLSPNNVKPNLKKLSRYTSHDNNSSIKFSSSFNNSP